MTTLFRSSLYQEMYPDELMLQAFGKLNPSASERNTYFFDLWMKRRQNKLVVTNHDKVHVKQVLKQLGLREQWDYQLRDNQIRFETKEDEAMFKLTYRENHG